jgi:hypothetical protein
MFCASSAPPILHITNNIRHRHQHIPLLGPRSENPQPGDALQTSEKEGPIQGAPPGRQSPAEGHRHAGLHRETQKAELGKAQGRPRAAHLWENSSSVHTGRGTQPPRAQRGARQRGSRTGPSRRAVSRRHSEPVTYRLRSLMNCFFFFGLYSYKLVRGAADLGGVANRVTARSRYGGKRPIWLSSVSSSDSTFSPTSS